MLPVDYNPTPYEVMSQELSLPYSSFYQSDSRRRKEDLLSDRFLLYNFNSSDDKFISCIYKKIYSYNINEKVFNNFLDIYYNLFEIVKSKISIDDIYTSEYGTMIIDVIISQKNIVIDIGKTYLGYFTENNGHTIDYEEELAVDENSIQKLNNSFSRLFS